MAGGPGDDTCVVDQSGDVVTEGADQGTDTVNAWVGWTLGANLEQLQLLGTGDLDGTGNGLANSLVGNAGKNVLNGGAGADTMTGGLGDDTYIVDQSDDVVVEALNAGTTWSSRRPRPASWAPMSKTWSLPARRQSTARATWAGTS